jgi:hypothetical protein
MNDDLSDLFEEEPDERIDIPAPFGPFVVDPVEAAVTRAVASGVRISQSAFQPVVDELTGLYRNLDKTYRKDIKLRLKATYDRLAELGATFGVSRISLGNLWRT